MPQDLDSIAFVVISNSKRVGVAVYKRVTDIPEQIARHAKVCDGELGEWNTRRRGLATRCPARRFVDGAEVHHEAVDQNGRLIDEALVRTANES